MLARTLVVASQWGVGCASQSPVPSVPEAKEGGENVFGYPPAWIVLTPLGNAMDVATMDTHSSSVTMRRAEATRLPSHTGVVVLDGMAAMAGAEAEAAHEMLETGIREVRKADSGQRETGEFLKGLSGDCSFGAGAC